MAVAHKRAISVGLLYIPVGLYKTTKDISVSFNQLCNGRYEKNGVPDFYEVQKRALMSNPFKIKLTSDRYPTSIIVYDILYYKDRDITMLPLMERKKYLEDVIKENSSISASRYIENNGITLYELVKEKGLEGIVAMKKSSLYWQGKRSLSPLYSLP